MLHRFATRRFSTQPKTSTSKILGISAVLGAVGGTYYFLQRKKDPLDVEPLQDKQVIFVLGGTAS
jgi:uncharacterized membrane protein (DUF373 family)